MFVVDGFTTRWDLIGDFLKSQLLKAIQMFVQRSNCNQHDSLALGGAWIPHFPLPQNIAVLNTAEI